MTFQCKTGPLGCWSRVMVCCSKYIHNMYYVFTEWFKKVEFKIWASVWYLKTVKTRNESLCYLSDRKYIHTVFPYIVSAQTILFEFGNPKITVHKGAETIQGRKLFKGGNYMRKHGIQNSIKIYFRMPTDCLVGQNYVVIGRRIL